MKKINLLLTALLLGTAATWAAGLSFTIYPEASGTFQIYYSTDNAPSGNCVIVDWGNGSYVYSEADTGSNPSKSITGTVTVGKPIKIYCDYIDAIQINSRANFIKCEPNNPQLQYIYYFFDNLSPENLEALYLSLISRNGKDDYGELHLSQTASIETASTNILKSNAFIPEGLNWRVCSMRSYTGSSRTNWKLDEANCKKYLIPAITITTSTTANITDLQLGIKQSAQLPWNISSSTVRIDDGTSNHKSVNVLSYSTSTDFVNNAPKLTVKGMGADKIKIYGALVSHFKTTSGQITNNINFDNTTNLRYIYTANNNQIGYIWGLRYQILLEELYLKNMPNTGSFEDLYDLTKLKVLNVGGCRSITRLYFNKTNIESLDFTDCEGLDPYSISLFPAPKLKSIGAAGLGWDACEMDVFYSRLPSNAASDAKVWVNDVYANGNQNNSYGSNKIIANDSGWKVWSAGLTSDSELTGDGGGCNFTYIPDMYFLQALKDEGYGDGAFGKRIPTDNLSGITTLDVRSRYIDNLTGIQDFVALKELNCSNNKLTSLDVSKNTKLTKLITTGQTSLSVLDVSKNTDLTYLWCDENKLTTLDLSKNTKLTTLSCKNNELTTLDMRNGNNANVTDFDATNNPNLSCIYVDNKAASYLPRWRKDATAKFVNTESECGATVAYTNIPDNNFLQALKDLGHGTGAVGNDIPTANLSTITSLTLTYKDISSLTGIKDFAALEILKCDGNNLTSLDVSKNIALTFLDCEQNQITILNVSGNTALRILNCADNALTSINLSKNVALEELICYENQIESIDISKNTKLISLKCSSNLIPILDVSKNTALTDIDCVDNDLKTLDVSKNTALKDLDCRYNKISVLDLSMNTKLTGLYCNDNELISLDVRNGNNANVTHFNATNNPNLSCIYVDNKTASYLSGWKKDASARFFNNESECGTSVNDFKEQDISIYPNPTNGIVNFDFAENRVQSIKISDVVGKMVFVKNNPNQKEEIDLSGFANGIYTVTVQMYKEIRSFKIIKQ